MMRKAKSASFPWTTFARLLAAFAFVGFILVLWGWIFRPELGNRALVYDPGHPHANEDGYVLMPNVNLTEEMVDMMDARRLFEANASVFQAIKSMMHRAAQL